MLKPKISVIVCCYNSSSRISKTLEYLSNQKVEKDLIFEVIVVDNASTDQTREIAEDYWKNLTVSIPFKVVLEPLPGLSNARTKGILESNAEIIIFCDDDNWLDHDYLNISYKIMMNNKLIGALGGQGFIESNLIIPAWFEDIKEAFAVGEQAIIEGDITQLKGYIWGAGMVLRRDIWNKILEMGFKTFQLSGRISSSVTMAGEDSEICLLIQNAGYKIYYSKSLKFLHAIPQERINWNHYKNLCKGFARSQVLLENYIYHFNDYKKSTFNKYLLLNFFTDISLFIKGCITLNYYKVLYKEFIQKEEGYLHGSYKRRYFNRIMARIKFYKLLLKAQKTIKMIEKSNSVVLQ